MSDQSHSDKENKEKTETSPKQSDENLAKQSDGNYTSDKSDKVETEQKKKAKSKKKKAIPAAHRQQHHLTPHLRKPHPLKRGGKNCRRNTRNIRRAKAQKRNQNRRK